MKFIPIGDTALTLAPEPDDRIPSAADLAAVLMAASPPGVVDVLPAFDRVTVVYVPAAYPRSVHPVVAIQDWIISVVKAGVSSRPRGENRLFEIRVRYGGKDGPDLRSLAQSLRSTPDALIAAHSGADYTAAAVGFLPGFAYLDGLPAPLHAPRRATPRVKVPAGSVAIGGPYTGVYPVESPGGWHVIGRTTRRLFDPARPAALSLRVGDRVRFIPMPQESPSPRKR